MKKINVFISGKAYREARSCAASHNSPPSQLDQHFAAPSGLPRAGSRLPLSEQETSNLTPTATTSAYNQTFRTQSSTYNQTI